MIKALIFDFDGLILDTETPEYVALSEAYAEMGHSLAVETYGQVVGSQYNGKYEPVEHLQNLTGKLLDREKFWKKVNDRRLELIEKNSILPGVEDYIQQAKALGLGLAVASSSSHFWVDNHLKRNALFDFFDVIRCKEDVQNIKPHPDLFLSALNGLQVQPHEAIIFEDSGNGVLAACRAGIRVVLVPNPITKYLDITGEYLRLNSLKDISLSELLNKM